MIFNKLQEVLRDYHIVKVTEEQYNDVFQLEKSNPQYFSYEQDHELTYDECIKGILELPPNTSKDKKFFIGFYKDERLIAIMDYIEDYPSSKIAWIGLFMVHGELKGKGIGTEIIEKFKDATYKCNYISIQLGCIEENASAHSFWINQGFKEIRRVVTKENGRKDWNIIVMENRRNEEEYIDALKK